MKYSTSDAKQWVRDNLKGLVAVSTTPMHADGSIDEEGMRSNVDRILALPGVNGLYLNSIYQEFWTMTLEERMRVTEVITEQVNGRVPVIVGCNDTSARVATKLAKHAQESGADLVMVWPPFYGIRTQDGVQAYYEYIAERVDIGMCIYSTTLPELGHFLTPEAVERLAEIDNVCAVKEVSLSLSGYTEMLERCGHLLSISSPFEEYHFFGLNAYPDITPGFMLGSSRPLYMQSVERPYLANYWEAVGRGDIAGAAEAMRPIVSIANDLHSKYLSKGAHNIALTKRITELLGFAAGPVRAPMSEPPQEQVDEAVAVLARHGVPVTRSTGA